MILDQIQQILANGKQMTVAEIADRTPGLAGRDESPEIVRLLLRLDRRFGQSGERLYLASSDDSTGCIVDAVRIYFRTTGRPGELLGIRGDRAGVFQAALARGAFEREPEIADESAVPVPIADLYTDLKVRTGRPVFFPAVDAEDLDAEDGQSLAGKPAWRARRYVYSGLPLRSGDEELEPALQATLCGHPVPWTLVQLGLHIHLSGLGGDLIPLVLQPCRGEDGKVTDIELYTVGRPAGTWLTHLPQWMDTMGFRWVQPFESVEPRAVDGLLAVMYRAGALDVTDRGSYVLGESLAQRLFERPWYGRMVKGGKALRAKLLEDCGWSI